MSHIDVSKILKTILVVDTKKMKKQFEGRNKVGMVGLADYGKYYPLGLSFTKEVLVDQCDWHLTNINVDYF